jgi:peroxiredoxin
MGTPRTHLGRIPDSSAPAFTILFAVLAMLLLAGCGGVSAGASTQPTSAETALPTRPPATPTAVPAVAPIGSPSHTLTFPAGSSCCPVVADNTPSSTKASASPVTAQAPDQAPDVVMPTVNGGVFRLSDHRGQVVAFVAITTTGCTSCAQDIQAWAAVYPAYQTRGLMVLAMAIGPLDTPASVAAFRDAVGGTAFTWVIDQTGTIARRLHLGALDDTIIFDRSGHRVYSGNGPVAVTPLRALLDRAFDAS